MIEFGWVLPEQGAEEAWRNSVSARKLDNLKSIGAI